MNPTIDQELTDTCTSLEMARESAKSGDAAMMTTALKDVRKRVNRLLKALDRSMPAAATIDAQLPTSPPRPIKDGEA
jgi:hypothetical protein